MGGKKLSEGRCLKKTEEFYLIANITSGPYLEITLINF